MTTHAPRRTPAALASLLVALALTSCGTDGDSGAPRTEAPTASTASSSTPTASASASTSESVEPRPVRYELAVADGTVRATLTAPDRFRADGAVSGRLHFLPVSVVTDSTAERWGDFFLFSPTRVYRPGSTKLVRAPRDLVGWFTSNPGVKVLNRRTHDFRGDTAYEVNVQRDGSVLFPGDEPGPAGGLERYVLWQRDGSWLVGQASTFRGRSAITGPTGRDDVFMSFLRSARLVPKG